MSRQSEWRRFVKARRAELRDLYPCAAPTQRRLCPKHGTRVPQSTTGRYWDPERRKYRTRRIPLSQICKACRDELFEQLAREYVQQRKGEAA